MTVPEVLAERQLRAIEDLSTGKILVGGVGSGKSRAAIGYFVRFCGGSLPGEPHSEVTKPRDLYVFTTAKKRDSLDWEEEAALFAIGRDRETSLAGMKLTVDSWNNLSKYENLKGAFVIFDEQRLVGKGAWVKTFLVMAERNDWILLSATPGDKWEDYIPVFVANGFYKNRTEFTDRHAVYDRFTAYPSVKRWLEEGRLRRLRDDILVDMPFERHTTRHDIFVDVDYDKDDFRRLWVDRWNIFKDRPVRNASELFYLIRKSVNRNPSRLTALRDVLKAHPRVIVFYNFDYELDILRGLSDEYEVAEWNGHKHEEIPESDSWVYLVQYISGSEAWNCIDTDTVVMYSQTYSWRTLEQAKGRIDRANTPFTDLYYYRFVSKSFIDRAIMSAMRRKKDFNDGAVRRRLDKTW